MIEIESSIQHSLGQELAVQRMHQLVASLTERFPSQVHQVRLHLKDHWIDVSFAAYGYLVHWKAEVYDDQVALHGRIPDSASKFKRKIEEAILSRVEPALVMGASRRAA
ncbi:MAG: polyhydroxyalkanoic acid system family protein [Pirellulaceae bacterium]|jgi:hypothetical protein|nr:polyhydroxyalkanoic acid system family protein [Pirellulaceae bacterium]